MKEVDCMTWTGLLGSSKDTGKLVECRPYFFGLCVKTNTLAHVLGLYIDCALQAPQLVPNAIMAVSSSMYQQEGRGGQ